MATPLKKVHIFKFIYYQDSNDDIDYEKLTIRADRKCSPNLIPSVLFIFKDAISIDLKIYDFSFMDYSLRSHQTTFNNIADRSNSFSNWGDCCQSLLQHYYVIFVKQIRSKT